MWLKYICDTLMEHYNAQFSCNENVTDETFDNEQEIVISDIMIRDEDILSAISDMDPNSTAGPGGIFAKVLI